MMVAHRLFCLLALVFSGAIALAGPPPAGADVLNWVNHQLDGLFDSDKGSNLEAKTDVKAYLDRLDQKQAREPGQYTRQALAREAPAPIPPSAEWAPRVQDALAALAYPAGAQSGLTALEEAASRASLAAARTGFALPAQVLSNLARGTEPLRQLIVSCREALHDASSSSSLDRLHRVCVKLLGQIQNNHHLVQQARESLVWAHGLLDKSRQLTDAALERAGEVQSVPMVAAYTEVHLRARGNLESTSTYLIRAQSTLKATFAVARSTLSYVEQLKDKSFRSPSSTFTLEDEPEALDRLAATFDRMKETVTRALEGMQTAHGLLYVNQKALLELLYSLRPNDPAHHLGTESVLVVARAMTRAADTLAEGLQGAQVELARQKQWREALESYHTPLFELGPLPEWVFKKDTILVGGSGSGLAAGPAPDIDRVIASLEKPVEADTPLAPPVPESAVAMTELPLVEVESLPASNLVSEPSSSPASEDESYHLPQWY